MNLRKAPFARRSRSFVASALAVLAAASLALGGCSSSSGKPAADNGPVTITFWDNNAGPTRTPYWQQMLADFHRENPNITVNYVGVTNADAYQKYKTAIAAGSAPDVGVVDGSYLATLVGLKALTPLDDLLKSSPLNGKLLSTFVQATTDGAPGAKLYGLPFSGNLQTIWYRTDLFQTAGISGAPQTWDDFYADADKLTDRTKNQFGFTIRGAQGSILQLLQDMYSASGITDFFDAGGKSTIDDPRNVAAMQRFAALYNKDTPKADVNDGYPEMVAEFDNGQVGMMQHNLGSLPNHQKAIPGKFAATELPAAADGKHYVVPDVVTTLGLFSQSKHQDADWKLMQFLDSHAEDSYWNKIVGQIPGNTDVESDAWVAATPSTANAIRVLTAPDTVVVPAPMYLPDFGSIVQTDMVPSWQKVLLGTMSAPDFAKQMADAFTAAYQDYKKHNP